MNGEEEYNDDTVFDGPDVTPVLIAEAMSRDDPFYLPADSNPFAKIEGFRVGHKLVGKSFADGGDVIFDLPSPSSPSTPPCTPNVVGIIQSRKSSRIFHRKSQSLPSSPVLLRKAAERLHQESIYGSQTKRSLNSSNRYSFSAYGPRSKSVFFPEAVAQKLQFEMYDTGSPYDGRSREGSVESDCQLTFNNTYPVGRIRRFSNVDNHSSSVSPSSSYSILRQGSVNETGDNGNENVTFSVYPSIKYAADTKVESKFSDLNIFNGQNKDLPNPRGAAIPCEKPKSPLSSIADTDVYNPWSMRRETLKDTTIIEENYSSQTGIMETSV